MTDRRDDNLMNRFDEAGLRRFRAREGVIAVLVAAALLVLFQGPSILKAADLMHDGIGRELILTVGRPSNWIARKLPFVEIASTGTRWLHPEADLSGPGGFKDTRGLLATQVPPVTPAAFSAAELGLAPPPKTPLHKLLVTGDSMSQPLDSDLAETLVPNGINVVRDPHIGTGISTTFVVDWGKLAVDQVGKYHPDAVVVFLGANDGFPMQRPSGSEVACCSAEWAAIYANRARQIVNTYRQGGRARIYWITLPAPRDAERQHIARVVNAAIKVAVQPWASDVQLVDAVPVFTPGFVYRDAMPVAGKQTLVREADGVHLNEAGSSLLARMITEELTRSYTLHG
jgi:lysophospholipase L1-like esterase